VSTPLPVAGPPRTLRPGQTCRVWVAGLDGSRRLVHTSADLLLEAPNWDTEGRLLLNGAGRLWDLPADGSGAPVPIDAPGLPDVNNDHVLSPDGRLVYASANDWHVWALPRAGGTPHRITADDGRLHFLHGISPDGRTLAYVALEPADGDWWAGAAANVRLIEVDGTGDRPLTDGPRPDDGPEISPDGRWVYLSTEAFTTAPGHAQIARVPVDAAAGTGLERLTHEDAVHWFPHLDPTGRHATYLVYPAGTTGHPADLPVEIRVVGTDRWDAPLLRIALHGGQGTINVPSWSPDGTAFAYVDYPLGS
jgi:Tol biopolymer transport system component